MGVVKKGYWQPLASLAADLSTILEGIRKLAVSTLVLDQPRTKRFVREKMDGRRSELCINRKIEVLS